MKYVEYTNLHSDKETRKELPVDQFPDTCPICHVSLLPKKLGAFQTHTKRLEIVFKCTSHECGFLFVGYYDLRSINTGSYYEEKGFYEFSLPKAHKSRVFPDEVKKISETFVDIYNEALEAEKRRLSHIAGMGYRKSLEFLIKDYLIKYKEVDKEKIKTTPLGACIKDYIENKKIRMLAERATWLGNDEAHFVRKWEDKSVKELKLLIEIVANWISEDVLGDRLIEEMPNPKK